MGITDGLITAISNGENFKIVGTFVEGPMRWVLAVASKADLLDRGLIIALERIPEYNRRKIEDIVNEFDRLKPQLLGYIFDILVKILRVKNNKKDKEMMMMTKLI
jgi:hypothetical protein